MPFNFYQLLILLFLLAAVLWDFRSRRIPNLLNLSILLLCIAISAINSQSAGFTGYTLGVLTSFSLGTLCFALSILGGGDIKLLFALSPLFVWQQNIELYFYSFLWGAAFGLVNSMLKKESKLVLFNIFSLIKYRKKADIKTSPIPFSVAIFFGYLSLELAKAKGISLL